MTTEGQYWPPDETSRLSQAEVEVRAAAVERLTFFADAVVAIAITLLALDLPVPHGATATALWHDAAAHRSEYLAFAISFIVISAHWRGHHALFRYVTYLDGKLAGLTMGWLFCQVITPFATRVITGDGGFALRFTFYSIVQLAAFTMFTRIVREIETKRLYRNSTPANLFRDSYLREVGMALGFLVSIPVAFLTGWAYLCWVAGPLVVKLVRRSRSER